MQYFVIGSDGQQYGPVDINGLNHWIQEQRVTPETMLAPEGGGPPVPASQVQGLVWQQPSAPAATPTMNRPMSAPGPSGMATSSYASYPRGAVVGGGLPDEVRSKWNWGAFFFSWIWGLNHRAYLTLLAFVPCVGFFVAIYAGIKGNEWAWESGRFSSVQEMEDCQIIWAKWAMWFFVIGVLLRVVLFAVIMATGQRPQ